jgi:hypothetical protein
VERVKEQLKAVEKENIKAVAFIQRLGATLWAGRAKRIAQAAEFLASPHEARPKAVQPLAG